MDNYNFVFVKEVKIEKVLFASNSESLKKRTSFFKNNPKLILGKHFSREVLEKCTGEPVFSHKLSEYKVIQKGSSLEIFSELEIVETNCDVITERIKQLILNSTSSITNFTIVGFIGRCPIFLNPENDRNLIFIGKRPPCECRENIHVLILKKKF